MLEQTTWHIITAYKTCGKYAGGWDRQWRLSCRAYAWWFQ